MCRSPAFEHFPELEGEARRAVCGSGNGLALSTTAAKCYLVHLQGVHDRTATSDLICTCNLPINNGYAEMPFDYFDISML